MSVITFAIIIAIFFYAFFPLVGAFTVRHRWREFRKYVIKTSTTKEISYADIKDTASNEIGVFSFTGELQAIQNENSIWLNNGKVSVRAEMKGVKIFILPSSEAIANEGEIEENKEMLPRDMPKRVSWNKLYSMAQGTGICIFGNVFIEDGSPVFRSTEDTSLFVIIFDGKKETILRRSIWSGRQINEYWHNLTPFSLVAGSFFLFVLSFMKFKSPGYNYYAIAILVLSLFPAFPFCPPGVVLYLFFKRIWRNARYLRGERDLLRLPLRVSEYEKIPSCKEALEKYPEAKIRSCGLINKDDVMSKSCRVYGFTNKDKIISNYFLEKIIIPGNPEQLAFSCRKKARLYEFLAMASLSTGVLINLIVIIFILYFLF